MGFPTRKPDLALQSRIHSSAEKALELLTASIGECAGKLGVVTVAAGEHSEAEGSRDGAGFASVAGVDVGGTGGFGEQAY